MPEKRFLCHKCCEAERRDFSGRELYVTDCDECDGTWVDCVEITDAEAPTRADETQMALPINEANGEAWPTRQDKKEAGGYD